MNQKKIIIHEKLSNIGKHSGRNVEFRNSLVQNRIDPFLFFYESNNNRNHMVNYKTLAKNVTQYYMVNSLDY